MNYPEARSMETDRKQISGSHGLGKRKQLFNEYRVSLERDEKKVPEPHSGWTYSM